MTEQPIRQRQRLETLQRLLPHHVAVKVDVDRGRITQQHSLHHVVTHPVRRYVLVTTDGHGEMWTAFFERSAALEREAINSVLLEEVPWCPVFAADLDRQVELTVTFHARVRPMRGYP